jgi:hypothetical protein
LDLVLCCYGVLDSCILFGMVGEMNPKQPCIGM